MEYDNASEVVPVIVPEQLSVAVGGNQVATPRQFAFTNCGQFVICIVGALIVYTYFHVFGVPEQSVYVYV